MDEFARMMSMEGVRPLDQSKSVASRPARRAPSPPDRIEASRSAPGAGAHSWVTGPRARSALETAIGRLAAEIRDGRRGWATGVRQDGGSVTLPATSGAAALLGTADRQSLRLILIGGDGWTFVMHPMMGVATLDEDPAPIDR